MFGKEPQPKPTSAFWNHMDDLYAIHDQLKEEHTRKMLQRLILTIQTEATLPKEVTDHGNHQLMAHQGTAE